MFAVQKQKTKIRQKLKIQPKTKISQKNTARLFMTIFMGISVFCISIAPMWNGVAEADKDGFLAAIGCNDDNGDGDLEFTDCLKSGKSSGPVTSFSNFQGDLKPPNPEGYAAGLTQATDARTYILNVTNFFLGFLGLIAILVIIYGGVRSVVSVGNPEGVGKAKKAVLYAVGGLLLVMGSFALVNTVLLAPGGRETGGTGGGVFKSTTIRGVAGNARFNYLSKQIEQVAIDVYNSYQFHIQATSKIHAVKENFEVLKSDIENCDPQKQDCVEEVRNRIKGQLQTLSGLTQQGNAIFNTKMSETIMEIEKNITIQLPEITKFTISTGCNERNVFIDLSPCTDTNKEGIRNKLKAVIESNTENLNGTNLLHKSYKDDMESAFNKTNDVYTAVKGMSPDVIGKEYFDAILGGNFKSSTFEEELSTENTNIFQPSNLSNLDQTNIKTILQNLLEIRALLENIKFVNAVITADVTQGNAPLIVNFSSVGSTDPSGLSIQDDQIEWDLDGNGTFSEGEITSGKDFINCNEKKGAIASCTFKKAGTYRVKLKINPKKDVENPVTGQKWNQETAPGIAYIDILVNPPATKINLKVQNTDIIKYNDHGNIEKERDTVYVTLAEAKAGLTFDASKTTLVDGTTPVINDPNAKIRWNFGVPSENNDVYQIPTDSSLRVTQTYNAIGNYQVLFEVIDKNGVIDRKIFTVVISDLAPRITNPPTSGKIKENIVFDGSNSTSSGGKISFEWKVAKVVKGGELDQFTVKPITPSNSSAKNEYFDCKLSNGKDDTLNCIFHKAGDYSVILTVNNGSDEKSDSASITITSNASTSSFKTVKISNSVPAVYKLDGKSYSFDPDEKDNSTLEYSWEINPDKCVFIGYGDQSTDSDLIKYATDSYSAQKPCTDLKAFSHTNGIPVVKFTEKGDYTINLTTRTSDEEKLESLPNEQIITVDNVLDVAWGNMKPSAVLTLPKKSASAEDTNTKPVAPIKFNFISSQAISYELDFGDGTNQSGEMIPGKYTSFIHNYEKTGKFEAKLSVFDADDIENTISRKIFIGDSDSPIAIISVSVNGSEVEPLTVDLGNKKILKNAIVINRKDTVTFDAGQSVNTDGTGRRLGYSWNINNFEKQSTARTIAHNFSSISAKGEPYKVKLKVTNERNATQNNEDEVNILVVGEQPTAQSLTAVPTESDLTTPVTVSLTAVGAKDPDGEITQYKWWYYDASKPATPDERLGLQITTSPKANLIIGTRGLEGEKPKYKFGMELTDNDNMSVSTDAKDENKRLIISTPEVQVTNGPNKAPIARFTVDRTSVQVGETVNFSSTSVDPDPGGAIKEYKWDFGDGSRGENRANVSHTYKKANVEGYKVRLTVVDNNASEAVSDTMRIYVDAEAEPPVPGFVTEQKAGEKIVKFKNTSTADVAAGAEINRYSWDFDVTYDSNGDGKPDNDIDSGEMNPSYTYPNFGIYRAKLTVEDNHGQVRSVTNFVNLKPESAGVTTGTMDDMEGDNHERNFNSAYKSIAANVFEAGHHVEIALLMTSIGAYVILFMASRRKKKNNSTNNK